MDDFEPLALEILKHHGYSTERVLYLGSGEQSVCYGAGDVALLINRGQDVPDVREANPFPLQQWLAAKAINAGVKTTEILTVGDRQRPYALMRRIHGINGATYNEVCEAQVAEWCREMGAQVRKINGIQTEGFGEFVPSGSGGYRGRYPTWSAYLEACIAKYLFMGPLGQEERAVRDLFLIQDIISSVELEKIATQLDAAKSWGTQSVLVHYDNRLANLIVDSG
ncbi:MAG TPA: phosphotransferase, partial [Ardenticatenaceae bacterium]|nr:phosphotransferase [Ardenticatenaceae bacterium]